MKSNFICSSHCAPWVPALRSMAWRLAAIPHRFRAQTGAVCDSTAAARCTDWAAQDRKWSSVPSLFPPFDVCIWSFLIDIQNLHFMHFHLTSSIISCQSLHIDFARRQDFFIYTGNIAARYFLHNKQKSAHRNLWFRYARFCPVYLKYLTADVNICMSKRPGTFW